ELQRLNEALRRSASELEKIKKHAHEIMDDTHATIFTAHLLILRDPDFLQVMKDRIMNDSVMAEIALTETTRQFNNQLKQLDNGYMKERISDIQDIEKRILAHLLGV